MNLILNFKTRLENITDQIESAQKDLIAGILADLGDMDKDITILCREIEASPPEIAKEMKPLIAGMISELDELAISLSTYQTQLQKGS